MLSVRHGIEAIEFYKHAFGAIELFRIENDKGEVGAQLSIDSARFWLADESPAHQNFSPESLGGATTRMILIMPDPGASFERAVAAGATAIGPVSNQHGWRQGRVLHPYGHHREIGKPLAEAS